MRKFLISASIIYSGFLGISLADTETVRWYVDNSLYDTTTCQTGGDINLPTAPTKYGYTFTGWTAAPYNLSTLNTSTNGEVNYAIVDAGQCWYQTSSMASNSQINCTNDNFTDLSAGLWKTKFSYGTVYGDSKCSSTSGITKGETGNPVDTTGKYCWCRATGFTPDGENMLYDPAVSLWVFDYSYSSTSNDCTSHCADRCGAYARIYSDFRAGLFGSN